MIVLIGPVKVHAFASDAAAREAVARLERAGSKTRYEWVRLDVKEREARTSHESSDGCTVDGPPGAWCGCQSCRCEFGWGCAHV